MKDIRKVLVIGAGPVVIGTGCEYDYAAVTVCNVLREKGIYSILINPNPVTVSTGSGTADKSILSAGNIGKS
jgi:carbamoyl-phosphate synthase large subunit